MACCDDADVSRAGSSDRGSIAARDRARGERRRASFVLSDFHPVDLTEPVKQGKPRVKSIRFAEFVARGTPGSEHSGIGMVSHVS